MDSAWYLCYNSMMWPDIPGNANVAQSVEQLIRNQQVRGSSPLVGSICVGA